MLVLGLLVLLSRGGALVDGADARVDMRLADSVGLDEAREDLTTRATASWQATRTAENTESDDSAMVEFTMPGSSMDGFIAELRRYPDAADVKVTLDVDADRVAPRSLGSADPEERVEPVTVQVNLSAQKNLSPLVTIIGLLLVALLAAGAAALLWRRFGGLEIDDAPEESPRRWTHRP